MNEEKYYTAVNKTIRFCRMHRSLIESKIKTIGIPRTAHRALMYLEKNGTLSSQRALAEHLEITPAAVTGVLQRLEADGYIERTLGTDNRYNETTITEKGITAIEMSKGIFRDVDKAMFEGFSDEELEVYVSFLERMKENAEGYNREEEKNR